VGRTQFVVLLLLLNLCAIARVAHAQTPAAATSDPLYQTIAKLDTEFFDAYNSCDLETVAKLVASDLEFYHDQTGLALGRQSLVDSLKQNICGKVRRALVPGSMEVYPLKGYGAVQIGLHRFHHPGKDDVEPVGEAKFIMLWQEKNGTWQMTRVISYDHAAAK
jgi:hypothetical protein